MSRSRLPGLLLGVAAAAFLLDRLTKLWAESALRDAPPIRLIPGVLHLTYATNTGGAFGILQNLPWLFAAATIGVSIAIVLNLRKVRSPLVAVALGLILGGALGNLADRVQGGLRFDGTVTDFIDVRIWPVFNIADSCVVIGAILLALSSFRKPPADDVAAEPGGSEEPAPAGDADA